MATGSKRLACATRGWRSLVLLTALLPSCRCSGDDPEEVVAAERRALEGWLTSAGGHVEPPPPPARTRSSLAITWNITSDRSWADYQQALLVRQPQGYPACFKRDSTVVCRRELAGDVFVIEVAPGRSAREFIARFRANEY
jgi:hypothetical protein